MNKGDSRHLPLKNLSLEMSGIEPELFLMQNLCSAPDSWTLLPAALFSLTLAITEPEKRCYLWNSLEKQHHSPPFPIRPTSISLASDLFKVSKWEGAETGTLTLSRWFTNLKV